jgi:hypothetical protein
LYRIPEGSVVGAPTSWMTVIAAERAGMNTVRGVGIGAGAAHVESKADGSAAAIDKLVRFPVDIERMFRLAGVSGKAGKGMVANDTASETQGGFVQLLKGMPRTYVILVVWAVARCRWRGWEIGRDVFAKGAGARRTSIVKGMDSLSKLVDFSTHVGEGGCIASTFEEVPIVFRVRIEDEWLGHELSTQVLVVQAPGWVSVRPVSVFGQKCTMHAPACNHFWCGDNVKDSEPVWIALQKLVVRQLILRLEAALIQRLSPSSKTVRYLPIM